MSIEMLEFQILVLDSALNSHKMQVARCKRILDRADQDYKESVATQRQMEKTLEQLRGKFVARAV